MIGQDAYISIDRVTKRFGDVVAVDQVDLQIRGGEFFSLLGASGCGKTTLLRMLAGFETPSDGEIHIDGTAISGVPPHRRPTNMVFQNYAIFPHLNVHRNIAYGLRTEKLTKSEKEKRVDEALELVKLQGFGDRKSDELSGGQRQRVALARALIRRPKVLLLDEPLGALDKKLREEMQLELRALQQSLGVTFIFVTHDQEEAMTLSDRIAVMSSGKVLQVAAPKEVYNRPVNVEVADFIGQMNFFDARITEVAGGQVFLHSVGLGRVATQPGKEPPKEGDRLVVAIRPEKLTLSDGKQAGVENCVQGVIETAAYLGDRSHFYVALEGCAKPVAVAAQDAQVLSGQSLESGRPVWLSWASDSIVLLEQD